MMKSNKLKLKSWVEMGDLQQRISKAAENNDPETVSELILKTISLVSKKNHSKKFWMDTVSAYTKVHVDNAPSRKFPMLQSKEKGKPLPWEYEGRGWYFWLNLFAENYGWTRDEVGDLEVDDAIGLYQEILIKDQLRQEWEWGLSEVSYSYDKSSKKSKPIKLPRPDWMSGIVQKTNQPPQTVKIHKHLMPVGNVVDLGGVKNETT